MTRHRPAILPALLLSCLIAGAMAADYHIDFAGGDDARDGLTPATAWKRSPGDPEAAGLAAACTPQPGDRLRFKGGVVYRGGVAIPWSGTAEQPIVLDGNSDSAYGTGRAIFDGAQPVTGWTRCADAAQAGGNAHFAKLWRAKLPGGTTAWGANLLQGGKTLGLAQHPTPKDRNFTDVHAEYVQTTAGQLRDGEVTHPILRELGGQALVGCWLQLYRSTNRVSQRRVTGWDEATGTARFDKLETPPYKDRGALAVVNSAHSTVLDAPGEYVVLDEGTDRAAALLWPLEDQEPEAAGITTARVETAFRIRHRIGHVRINGFHVRNFQYGVTNHEPPHWNNETDRNHAIQVTGNLFERMRAIGGGRTGAVYLIQVEDALFADNEVRDTFKARGICLHTASRSVIRGNRLSNIFGGPLTLFMSTDCTISGNRVADSPATHTNGITVYAQSRGITIADNVVYNSNIAMTCEESADITIRGNVFDGRDNGAQPLSFWHKVTGRITVEGNILLSGGKHDSGFTISGLNDKTGATFTGMQTTLRGNIMSGPMIMAMNGKPWTTGLTAGGNIFLSTRAGHTLAADERVEPNLGKLVGGLDDRTYHRLAP